MEDSVITVFYREVEAGWHMFTSEDVPGLLVASPDRVRAFNDVPRVLRKLHFLNTGVDCTFTPAMSADEFFDHLQQKVDFRKAA